MRKAIAAAVIALLPTMAGCALSDIFYNLFGDAYSAGGHSDAARQMDYNDRVGRMNAPPSIPGSSSNPFTP